MDKVHLSAYKDHYPTLVPAITRMEEFMAGGGAEDFSVEEVAAFTEVDRGLALVLCHLCELEGALSHYYVFSCPATGGEVAVLRCQARDLPDVIACPHESCPSESHRTDDECWAEVRFERPPGAETPGREAHTGEAALAAA